MTAVDRMRALNRAVDAALELPDDVLSDPDALDLFADALAAWSRTVAGWADRARARRLEADRIAAGYLSLFDLEDGDRG